MPVESDGINLQMKLMGLLGMMPEVVSGSYVHVYTHTHLTKLLPDMVVHLLIPTFGRQRQMDL